ncbi:MAG: peptide-methionine (R)-S-oxide reductase [Acidimicrobiaceae bacterium]|nr:peptide-methionine (R)-S-oxide reductase [Acidimicrobiaceae bacterium]
MATNEASPGGGTGGQTDRVELSEDEWRRRLTPEQFRVLREKGTDPAFTGRFTHPAERGTYRCAACGIELFDSGVQYDSGSGWPSFTRPVGDGSVSLTEDRSHGMVRIEVTCSGCGSHLGHVFDDGPGPEGRRWCINSTSLSSQGPPPAT